MAYVIRKIIIDILGYCVVVSTTLSKRVRLGSSPSAPANFKKNMTALIREMLAESILTLEQIDEVMRAKGLENTQEFIDWQDNLNRISVK